MKTKNILRSFLCRLMIQKTFKKNLKNFGQLDQKLLKKNKNFSFFKKKIFPNFEILYLSKEKFNRLETWTIIISNIG